MLSDTNSSTTDRQQQAAALSLISGLWLREVDRDMANLLRSSPVAEAYQELGGSLPADDSDTTLEALAADYCQLLIGPKEHLPPIQSVWADQKFQSLAAASTHRFYDLFPAYQPPGSIDDHLGNQLDFTGFLLTQSNSEPAVAEVLQRFHDSHLTWADRLLTRVTQKADTDFYRGLADISTQLISGIR